jgi:hypothetical protein
MGQLSLTGGQRPVCWRGRSVGVQRRAWCVALAWSWCGRPVEEADGFTSVRVSRVAVDLRAEAALRVGDVARALTLREQTGQAPQPCRASTFSATVICSSRLAPLALPLPP